MTKYLIRVPYDRKVHDHWEAQTVHMSKFSDAGLKFHDFKWVSGTSNGVVDYHTWRVSCTEEQLTYLAISCNCEISHNLTEQARRSGLAKLNEEEKEALGLPNG